MAFTVDRTEFNDAVKTLRAILAISIFGATVSIAAYVWVVL
jgi:hypothetical protein